MRKHFTHTHHPFDAERAHAHDGGRTPGFHNEAGRDERVRRFSHGFGPGRGFGPGFGPAGGHGPGFGPKFGPRGHRRAGKGDVRAAILSLLAEGPSNGYGLIKGIAEKTDGVWRPSPGSVYPTLQQLVDEELIEQGGTEKKPVFELSESGRTYVSEHAEELEQGWRGVAGMSESATSLRESAMQFMGVMQQFRLGATDEQQQEATKVLDDARKALYAILAK
ncbi:PadR family transcriptional regulator [Pseudoclavibacter helvolus]|uniref:PadR family transcriptional regulator n=1 Tax=Pseudoclavibacter helvolus TaxID=255205 RepID=UPI003C743F1C